MPYLADYAITYLNAAVTAAAMNMPVHQANDILVMWVTMDTLSATIASNSGTAWTAIANNTTQASITASWAWKRAQNAAETISITTGAAYSCGIYCIRDVDLTTAIDISTLNSSAVPTLPAKPISDAVTTTTADCFVLYLLGSDLIATAAHSAPGVQHIISFDNQGTSALTSATQSAAWYMQRAAAAVPTPNWSQSAAAAYVKLTIALRNVSGGIIPAYIDDVSSPATVVATAHSITANVDNVIMAGALTNTAAVNGKTVALVAAALQADLGINSFSSGIAKATATAARTTLNGYEITLTGGRNLSTGLLVGSFIGSTPKQGTFGMGSVAEGGCVIRIGSSATAWCAYQVAAKNAVPTLENRSVWAIQPGFTTSAYGTPGTAVTTTAVTYLQVLTNQPSFNSNTPLSEVYQAFAQIVAGGTSAAPVDTDGIAVIGKSFRLPVIQKFGGAGLLSFVPIQIGGGDAVNFQIDAGALQFPRRYNTTTKEIGYHAADNSVGISYAGKSGDVVKHTNSIITSPTPYYWNINAAATSAATWDFSGTTIIGAAVTLRPVVTFTDMAFSNCSLLATTGSILNNCKFSNTTVSASSPANAALVSSSTFTKISGTSHGLEITGTAANITLSGLTFTGYAASNGSTGNEAIYVNIATGSMTITIAAGGTLPSIRTAGAAITVINNKILTLTGLITGSDIVILTAGTTTERVNVDANAGTTYAFSYTYTASDSVDVAVYKQGYVPFVVRSYLLPNADGSLPIAQVVDRNFNNPV